MSRQTGNDSLGAYVRRITADLSKVRASALPDFIVLSPPRTGTTWLASALSKQPGIYIPPEKELNYFSVGWKYSNIGFYIDRFSPANDRIKGDASPGYVLLPSEIIAKLCRAKPSLKFIVIERDMAERAWSNLNHSYAIGEFGLRSASRASAVIPERSALSFLIGDYSTVVGDYARYLPRWLKHFPADQFFVFGIDEIEEGGEVLLKRMLAFLGAGSDEVVPIKRGSKVNSSVWTGMLTENVRQLMSALYESRQPRQYEFLAEKFGYRHSGMEGGNGLRSTIVNLIDRADGFRVFVWDGSFYACFLEDYVNVTDRLLSGDAPQENVIVSEYYSDLVGLIDAKKRGVSIGHRGGKSVESERLFSILDELSADYPKANALRTNLNTATMLREHLGYNVFAVGGVVMALQRALGPIELGGEELDRIAQRYGADKVIIGHSLGEVLGILNRNRADTGETARVSESEAPEAAANGSGEPVRLEADFLGCNLVGYNNRVYAVPMSAGRLAVDALPREVLDSVPSASTVAELKVLLTIGPSSTQRRKQEIEVLGATLARAVAKRGAKDQ